MICRRCGAEISGSSMRCRNCGIKVNIYCPTCHTLNFFGEKFCVNCGSQLILSCDKCGASNIYYAANCRKCNYPLLKQSKSQFENKDVQVVESFSVDGCSYISNKTENNISQNSSEDNPSKENVFSTQLETTQTEEEMSDTETNSDKSTILSEYTPAIKNHTSSKFETLLNDYYDNEDKPLSYGCIEKEQGIENENSALNNETLENSLNETSQADDKKTENKETSSFDENNDLPCVEDEQECSEQFSNREIINETMQLDQNEQPISNEDTVKSSDSELNNSIEETSEIEESNKENIKISENTETQDYEEVKVQKDTVIKIINLIKNSLEKHIIAVDGAEGTGKSAILKQVSSLLSDKGYLSLYGSCTPLVRITSFGFFQDALLRIMGFPPYAKSTSSFIRDFQKSDFAQIFSFLNEDELKIFLNIFYPAQKDNFDNIMENKMKIFSILEKVIKSFLLNNNLIILINNFEMLDGASYDFIVYMIKNGFFNNRLKLLAAYQGSKDIKSYFELSSDEEKMFETIEIKKCSRKELLEAAENTSSIKIDEIIDENMVEELIEKSDGNAVRMEQEVALLFDTGFLKVKNNEICIDYTYKPENNYKTFDELIKSRLNFLPPSAKNVLFMAAIMGYRFSTSLLCLAVAMPDDKAASTLDFLINNLFIQHVDNYTCEFKSLAIWKIIYQEAKADLLYKDNASRLYSLLKPLILSSNLQKLIACSEALTKNEEFVIWQETASISAKLGDTNLYIISLKKCLELIDMQNIDDIENVKLRIYEEIGKLLCEKSSEQAIDYLSTVLKTYIDKSDTKKIIDISGYFVKSCYLTGKYFGAIEAVDAILKVINSSDLSISDMEIALIKTRKLNALLNIGNSEQLINLAEEEILPVIDKYLSQSQIEQNYISIILNAWFLTKITLAKAYAFQGNNKVNSTISDIKEAIKKYNYRTSYYKLNVLIIEAIAKTIGGNIHSSNEILNDISLEYQTKIMEPNLLAWWNFVNIINRVLMKRYNDLKVDLSELVVFANNINEHFIKNIVKVILGYVLKEEGNIEKAEKIYNEQIDFFAKEKIVIGALLTWALIVQKYIENGDIEEALKIASKALEISQSSSINNYFFNVYFQKFISDIYIKKTDFAAAKMYLEKSIVIAKQLDMKYQLIQLYVAYAKYIQEFMKYKKIYAIDNINALQDMYKKAIAAAKETGLSNMVEYASKEYSGFKTYCQLNSIDIS